MDSLGRKKLPLLDNIFGSHAQRLQLGLQRTSQRHGLLTNNLANVNTPGFKRKDIDFSVALDEARQADHRSGLSGKTLMSTRSARAEEEASVRVDGSSVDMEREVAGLAETDLRYQMLIEMTNRYFTGLKSAIRAGR